MSYHRLAVSVTAHAWNKERNLLAICPNNNSIEIHSYNGTSFELKHKLESHDAVVTSLAWAPNRNHLLSCSQDRNAYVWRLENDVWQPTLVLLRFDRAATCCAWSPNEDKIAVASGDKVVAVCYFDKEYDWWVSKHIKGFDSTVLSIAWHPNNFLLAAASSDNHVRVVSAYIKGIDNRDAIRPNAFGDKFPTGTICADIKSNGWVHSADWSPDGNRLVWISHDSTVHVLTGADQHASLKTKFLPFVDVLFVSSDNFVAVGHDNVPVFFSTNGSTIEVVRILDTKQASQGGNSSTISEWQNRAKLGAQDANKDQALNSLHQNCVTVIRAFKSQGGNITSFSTSGLDGGIAIWNI